MFEGKWAHGGGSKNVAINGGNAARPNTQISNTRQMNLTPPDQLYLKVRTPSEKPIIWGKTMVDRHIDGRFDGRFDGRD